MTARLKRPHNAFATFATAVLGHLDAAADNNVVFADDGQAAFLEPDRAPWLCISAHGSLGQQRGLHLFINPFYQDEVCVWALDPQTVEPRAGWREPRHVVKPRHTALSLAMPADEAAAIIRRDVLGPHSLPSLAKLLELDDIPF